MLIKLKFSSLIFLEEIFNFRIIFLNLAEPNNNFQDGVLKDYIKFSNLVMVCPFSNFVIIWNMIIKMNTHQIRNSFEKYCKIFNSSKNMVDSWATREVNFLHKNVPVGQFVRLSLSDDISRTAFRKFIHDIDFVSGSKVWKILKFVFLLLTFKKKSKVSHFEPQFVNGRKKLYMGFYKIQNIARNKIFVNFVSFYEKLWNFFNVNILKSL